jgi:LysM repeat protein
MKSVRTLAFPAAALFLASCAAQKEEFDTPANPYGVADASQVNPPANPIYDTPAVYQDSTAATAVPGMPADPAAVSPAIPTVPAVATAPPSNGAAIIHTVVAGDTLSGISSKYKVPIASIKTANRMTNDIVVLGRKMVIPPQ